MKLGRLILVHPLLLVAFPVVFLYSRNLDKVAWPEILLPAAIALAAVVLLWLLARLLFRDSGKAAAMVSIFFILFFALGLLAGAARSWEWGWSGYVFSPAALIILLASGLLVYRARSGVWVLNKILAVFTVALWLPVLVRIGSYHLFVTVRKRAEARPFSAAEVSIPLPSEKLPDIFYIIVDAYGRADILRDYYLFDNGPFLDYLRSRGFYVAEESVSNYPHTQQSLAASLNMVYLDGLAAQVGEENQDRRPLLDMLQHSRTAEMLRGWGYKIAVFASGYAATESVSADIHFRAPGALSEFQNSLLNFTPLPDLLDRWTKKSLHDLHRGRILYALINLSSAVRRSYPVFVFAHIPAPHPPFVFGAEGEALPIREQFTFADGDHYMRWYRSNPAEYRRRYLAQLTFINHLLEQAIDGILEASESPPVIIIQGDHGPGSMFTYDSKERTNLRERFSILNAYHLPGGFEGSGLYPGISPVNSFRLIFNRYFDQQFELLPDRSFFVTVDHPYRFIPVSVP